MSDSIFINAKGLEDAVRKLNLPKSVIQRIMRRAVARTARWAGTRIANLTSKATRVEGKILRGRMVVDIKSADFGFARVWLGLNPIGLHRLNPVQESRGVSTDLIGVPGGFISKGGNRGMKGKVFRRRGKSRLPVEKQTYPIEEAARPVIEKVSSEVGKRLLDNFESAYLTELSK